MGFWVSPFLDFCTLDYAYLRRVLTAHTDNYRPLRAENNSPCQAATSYQNQLAQMERRKMMVFLSLVPVGIHSHAHAYFFRRLRATAAKTDTAVCIHMYVLYDMYIYTFICEFLGFIYIYIYIYMHVAYCLLPSFTVGRYRTGYAKCT